MTPAHRGAARRGRLAAVLAGGAAVCLAAGAHLLTQPARADVADAGTVPVQTPAPSVAAAPPVQEVPPSRARITRSTPQPLPPLVLPPVTLAAADLHARARVVPVGTDTGGALELPDDPRTLGWWVGGAVPGAARGTVIVAGHIDTKEGGAGVMAGVIRLPIGARVSLTDAAGAQRMYRVVAVRSYPKRALPARLFTGATTARLVLVTCGGTFDAAAHHYSDNIVVYAVPVDA